MTVSLILACDRELGIGKQNALPWDFPEDLKFFMRTTRGATCVMGRLTYLSMLDHINPEDDEPLLKNRKAVVLSGNMDFRRKVKERPNSGAIVHPDEIASLEGDVFIIGGARLYEEGIKYAKYVYVTDIPGIYECDVKLSPEFCANLQMKFDVDHQEVKESRLVFTRYRRIGG